ncbi:MAG: DUF1566 domain-containing protein [Deltaproteobacteria bacterium]|nr:DUF1566 domain-containing protein [Deltaproteobacteria bacterium]
MSSPSRRDGPRRGKLRAVILGALLTLAGLATLGTLLFTAFQSTPPLSAARDNRTSRGPFRDLDPWTGAGVRLPITRQEEPAGPVHAMIPDRPEQQPAGQSPSVDVRPAPTHRAFERPAPRPEGEALCIRALAVDRSPDGTESLAILASGPFIPDVFPLKGENPFGSSLRLVVDVQDVESVAESVSDRDLNGQVLRRVRTSFAPGTRSFRAVLDLSPDIPFQIKKNVSPDGRFLLRLRKKQEKPKGRIQVRAITFRPSEGAGKERLLIQADRFFEPVVFGLEGDNPYGEDARIVVDIPDARPSASGPRASIGGGRLVRDIRTHYHARAGKLRVVLDLARAAGYEVSQAFFRKQNLYCLSITETGEPAEPKPRLQEERAVEEASPPERTAESLPSGLPATNSRAEEPGLLRSEACELDEDHVRAMFREHGFYSTCGIYNAHYCNQDGEFANQLHGCGAGVICDDATGLMWAQEGSGHPMSWNEAGAYIAERNRRRIGGHGDWRLPTLEELLSLMERSWGDGGLYISDLFDATPRSCWSGDTRGAAKAWKVNFHLGYAVDARVEEQNWTRAVRTAAPASHWAAHPPSSPDPAETAVMAHQGLWK